MENVLPIISLTFSIFVLGFIIIIITSYWRGTLMPQLGNHRYPNHSGGASGADSVWDKEGHVYNVPTKHYFIPTKGSWPPVRANTEVSAFDIEEAHIRLQVANDTLRRKYPTTSDYINNLLKRNWAQVKYSDAVFAITEIENDKPMGGTGWAVQMAIDLHRPVHLFSESKDCWFTWNGSEYVTEPIPVLTPNFAGIGSRNIGSKGRMAIKAVYEKTFK